MVKVGKLEFNKLNTPAIAFQPPLLPAVLTPRFDFAKYFNLQPGNTWFVSFSFSLSNSAVNLSSKTKLMEKMNGFKAPEWNVPI
jgi:hypothetical protein